MLLFIMCWDPECHLVMSEFALSSERTSFSLPIHRKRHFYNGIAPSDAAKADALDSGRFFAKGRTNYALVGRLNTEVLDVCLVSSAGRQLSNRPYDI